MKIRIFVLMLAALVFLSGCTPSESSQKRTRRVTVFIGIDVSNSFYKSGNYDDSLKFISHYIYGHIHGLGELKQPKALFVAPIGGFSPDEPKSFRPIHDFEKKSVEEIEADLQKWLVPRQTITDFNAFFEKVKKLIKKKNLILAPINIVIVSDGVPSRLVKSRKKVVRVKYSSIDLSSLEYLARNITVRLLYPSAVVAEKWEENVPRQRVRMWPVDDQVMAGWHEKITPNAQPEQQHELWKWMKDNVDYRVRRRGV